MKHISVLEKRQALIDLTLNNEQDFVDMVAGLLLKEIKGIYSRIYNLSDYDIEKITSKLIEPKTIITHFYYLKSNSWINEQYEMDIAERML